jgi:acyl-CoA thioesterase
MQLQFDRDLPVRSLQVSFVGPVDESDFVIESEVLREGKNVSQVLGRGTQNGQTKIVVQGSFGKGRDSIIGLGSEKLVLNKSVADTNKLPYIKGVIPEFTKHFDYRYCTAFPFAGGEDRFQQGYVRFDTAPAAMTEAHLLGLVDAWPPATLPLMKTACMASSLSWTIEFVHPRPSFEVNEYTQYEAVISESSQGFGYTRAKVSNEKGEILAFSQQTITHFA